MLTSAEQVCGKNSSNINLWMNRHEVEIKEMKDKIAQALTRRNLLKKVNTEEGNAELLRVKRELCNERRKYKDCCKQWEKDWWNEIADKCEKAWKLGRLGRCMTYSKSCRNVENIISQRIYFFSLKRGSKSIYNK